jgi:hypothetical protein
MAMVEGYVSLGKNAQDAKVSKTGKKNMVGWRGPCACRATASRADRIGSEGWFDTSAYQPVRMLGANPAIRLQARRCESANGRTDGKREGSDLSL